MADQKTMETFLNSLHWLGHDAFRLDTLQGPVYFDPYEISQGPKASLILVSHDHFDHCVPETISMLQAPDTVVLTEQECAQKLEGDVRVLLPGDEITVKGFKVKALPAYNTDKNFHPKKNNWLGFLLTIDGLTLYHAGDTDNIPEMKDLRPDIALLPVSGTYVMTAKQAAKACLAMQPKVAIPMHYGAIVGDEDDAQEFARLLKDQINVKILSKE